MTAPTPLNRSAAARALAIAFALLLALGASPALAGAAKRVSIAVLSDSHGRLEPLDEIVREEIRALLEGEFEVIFPPDAQRLAGRDLATAEASLRELYADDGVDMIVALGPRATQALLAFERLPKPSFGTLVLDRKLQGFPLTPEGSSGRTNLAYLIEDDGLLEMVRAIRDLAGAERVAFLIQPSYLLPDIGLEASLSALAESTGVEVRAIAAESPLVGSVDALPDDLQGVLVGPLFDETEEQVRALADALIERRLPSVAVAGSREVELGLLASVSPSQDLKRLGRRVALQIQDVLLGGRPEDLPVERESLRSLTVNLETASALDVPLRFDLLGQARLIGSGESSGRRLELRQAIEESLRENLDLRSQDRVVAAGREDVFVALSALLPQASVSATWSRIDRGRSGFQQAEETTTFGFSGQQLLFDQARIANVFIAQSGVDALDEARDQVRQDVIQATANAFLEVLRAQTTLDVQRSNLDVTRANLQLARTRNELGAAAAGEVLRWTSEEANAARSVVDARAAYQNQRIALNRLLNRPLAEEFLPVSISLTDAGLTLADSRFERFFETPLRFQDVADFLVQRGFRFAPELSVLDAQIEAQERTILSRRLGFALPSVGASARWDRLLEEAGAGQGLRLGGDENWSVGVDASLPLAQGGGRVFELRQLREQLSQLRIDRRSTALQVEERIRTAANRAAASFVAIELTRDAATASGKNLELVTESYARGALYVIDLIDAQNAAFSAEQQSANAVYDHLINLFELQRAIGRFEFLRARDDRRATLESFDAYLRERGLESTREGRATR